MAHTSIYDLETGVDALRNAFASATIPPGLYDALQALLTKISRQATSEPVSICLFASDDDSEMRDLFAYVLSKTVREHIPSAVLVDCDFLSCGMHGVVPRKDALGFLDFLLYGSSLGVITQETAGGVHVIGAGSFPVTKKMPFVMGAFEDAARRLLAHARCAVFTIPMLGDDGELHPLIGAATVPILLRVGEGVAGKVDAAEEAVTARWDCDLVSMRLHKPGAAPKAKPRATPGTTAPPTTEIDASPPRGYTPPPARPPVRVPEPPPTAEELQDTAQLEYNERSYTALVPRITTAFLGILVIAFVVWWFLVGRDSGIEPAVTSTVTTDTPPPVAVTPAMDTTIVGGAEEDKPPPEQEQVASEAPEPAPEPAADEVAPIPPPVDHTDTGGRTGGTVLLGSEDIHVMADVEQNWPGWYLIHISSFRESIKAREEVAYLESREFPVFIVFLDLGAKGKWYRVYAGPFRTREEAGAVKKNLDDIPRVRFTRMTRISQ